MLNNGKIQCLGSTVILINICGENRLCKVCIVKHRTPNNRLLFCLNVIVEYGLHLTPELEIKSHIFNFIHIATNYSNRRIEDSFNDSINLLVSDYDSLINQLTAEVISNQVELNLLENRHSSEIEYFKSLRQTINPKLSDHFTELFLEVLKSQDVFSKNKFEVGCIKVVKCTIPFIESFAPPFASPYPFSNVKNDLKMREIVDNLLEN